MQQPGADGLFDIGFGVDIAISNGGQKKRKPKKKKPQAKPLKKSYQSFAWTKGATALSAMNPSTQQLIADIFAGNAGATPFFNHGYDKDPETRGSISGTAFVSITTSRRLPTKTRSATKACCLGGADWRSRSSSAATRTRRRSTPSTPPTTLKRSPASRTTRTASSRRST